MIYAAFGCLIIGILICYFHDLKDARNGHINHSRGLKIKAGAVSISIILFFLRYNWPIHDWWQLSYSIGFVGAWFLRLFNGLWGLKVANDFFYRSTAVGKNLSGYDRIVLHWPKILYALFECGLCISSTIIYFKLWTLL